MGTAFKKQIRSPINKDYLIRICPVSSMRSTLEHPKRQEHENTQRLAGTANMTRNRLRVSSIENLEPDHVVSLSASRTFAVSDMFKIPGCHESAVIRGVVAGEPVIGAVVASVPPVVEVELRALVAQSVHASVDVDQELRGNGEDEKVRLIYAKSFYLMSLFISLRAIPSHYADQ